MITWYGKPGRAAHLPKWSATGGGFARARSTRCSILIREMGHVEPERLRDCCGTCVQSAEKAGLITVDCRPGYFYAPAPIEARP